MGTHNSFKIKQEHFESVADHHARAGVAKASREHAAVRSSSVLELRGSEQRKKFGHGKRDP